MMAHDLAALRRDIEEHARDIRQSRRVIIFSIVLGSVGVVCGLVTLAIAAYEVLR